MTELTDEAVKALLDGATPGAWAVNPKAATNVEAGRRGVAACGGYFDNTSDGAYAVENEANAHLIAAAPDLARALLDARAELAQARADAKAAQALVVERFRHDLQFMVDSIAEDKAYVADRYPALFKTIQARRAEMGTLGGVQVFGEIARDLLVLADADGLAAVDALRAEIADLKMNMDADLRTMVREGQQLRTLAAELAAAQQREAALTKALEACVASLERVDTAEGVCCCGDSMDRHSDPMSCGHSPVDMGDYYAGQALESARAALAPTPPADTWHERRTMLPDGDARKGEG